MDIHSQNDEIIPLLNKKNKELKWYQKIVKRPLYIVLCCILLLGVIYFLYTLFKNEIKPGRNGILNRKYPLHILNYANINNEYIEKCAPQLKCDPNAKYRSINGSCNNLHVPTYGASKTPFFRILDANFSDGHYKLRLQTNGSKLPNVRVINIELFLTRELHRPDENNALLMPFGQLIAHDVSGLQIDIPPAILDSGETKFCCGNPIFPKVYPQCGAIIINPPDDPVYGVHNVSCQNVIRSMTSANFSCPISPVMFMNSNTHFIDASEIYGSNDSYAHHLRVMDGGRLKFSISDNGQMFCPYTKASSNISFSLQDTEIQYDTGDPDNVNQNLGITAMQTLFFRFHNYIAFKLSYLNPFWSDETIYQETRRINIAVVQHIAYKDFLPIILGEDFQELYGLNKENIYDPTVNPAISQEFSSAAYRVLHTLIPVQFNFMDTDYTIESSITLTDWLKKPDLLPIDDNFDKLFKGLLETPGRKSQHSYNFHISNFMFHLPFQPPYTGLDLMAADITRGRDVGLQPYNRVRHFCGLPLAKDFDDLADLIHIRDLEILKKLYYSVDDIDLIVGLILEKHSDGAIVGPTTRCLIADGFYRSKAGDRFFYDVQGQPGSFTPVQLREIKKITFGHVLCAVSNVDRVQVDIFKIIDHKLFPTDKLICDEEFDIYLKAWEEPTNRQEF